jgi:putative endonuclease
MLECKDKTLYTGWTNDIEKRVMVHNTGLGSKYTRIRLPVILAYYEVFETKIDAQKREYAIKKLTKADKLELISNFNLKF